MARWAMLSTAAKMEEVRGYACDGRGEGTVKKIGCTAGSGEGGGEAGDGEGGGEAEDGVGEEV